MGAFSKRLTKTSSRLINKYGFDGVLTEIVFGEYNTTTTKREEISKEPFNIKYVKADFTTAELQTGLYGIDNFKAIVQYDKEIQKSWVFDGAEIINVTKIGAQNDIIVQELICRK